MLRLFSTWVNRVSFLATLLAAVLLAILCLEMFISVVFRYALRNPLGWYEELTRFLLVWGVMLGMAYTLREGRHIRLTTLTKGLPLKQQRFLEFFMDLIGIAVLVVFVVKATQFTLFTKSSGEISGGPWGFPIWWAELALPLGGGLFLLQYLTKAWVDLLALVRPPNDDRAKIMERRA